jgi:hypothetical protein
MTRPYSNTSYTGHFASRQCGCPRYPHAVTRSDRRTRRLAAVDPVVHLSPGEQGHGAITTSAVVNSDVPIG